ncbi:MAG: hypothetical protein OEN56_02915 [Gemmatimonadota bacterium]|nr:hypothetical protein [Gemmatimonadota bacterium]
MRLSPSSALAAIAAVGFLLPRSAAGQSIPSPFEYLERRQEIGVYVGTMSAGEGRFDYGPSGGLLYGTRYAIELSGPLSLEGLLGAVDGSRNVVDPGRVEGDRVIGEVDSRILLIDAGFRFTLTGRRSWHGLAPFISLGGGIALDLKDRAQLEEILLPEDVYDFGSSFIGTIGLGTRWFLTESIAARADGTFSLWKIDTPPGFSDPDRGFEDVADGEWINGTSLTLTLLYRW